MAELDMVSSGYKHGPLKQCHSIGNSESDYWEIEFAYEGQTGRRDTGDPPSIILRVNVKTKEVQSVDIM